MYTFKITVGPASEHGQGSWESPTSAAAEAIKHVVRNIDQYKYPASIEIFEKDRILFVLKFELERPDMPQGSPE